MRWRRGIQSALITFATAVLLAGCVAPEASESEDANALTGVDVSDASEAQAAEISDREATADEYQLAFNRYRECLSAGGYELNDVRFVNSLYEFGIPDAAVEAGVDEECYVSEFRYVDMLWQSEDFVQNSSETARFLAECLNREGIEPADTLNEMEAQIREAGLAVSDCLI